MACNNNGGVKPWKWPQEEDGVKKDSSFGMAQCTWTEVIQNEEDMSYMFDETTPVKACGGDFAYNIPVNVNMSKQDDECQQSYMQVKRRRMLQFHSHSADPTLCCEEAPSAFLRSDERDDSVEEVFSEASQWDYRLPASCEDVDQSTARWLADCLNDNDMPLGHDDMNCSGPSDLQIDISEFWNDQPSPDVSRVQQVTRTPQKIVFKGRKSFIRPPTKLASSVAYPFTFIKPSWVHGDVTLKDINQKIQAPPPTKTKQGDEDPSTVYPTSAFSGKPVVGKMKIRTEGGRGSITVMRTKG